MSTSTTLAYQYDFQPVRTPRSAEVNANFTAISTLINTTGIGTNNIKDDTFTEAKFENLGVVTDNLSDVEKTNLEASNYSIAAAVASFTIPTGPGFLDLAGASVTITTAGRPVLVMLQSSAAGRSRITQDAGAGIKILRDATSVALFTSPAAVNGAVSAIRAFDAPTAGTYTYKVQVSSPGDILTAAHYRLIAIELV